MRSLRSRRALLLAGGCCSSLLAAALPSEASAQSTSDQTTATQPADTTAPGDVNAQPPADQGAIVVTGIRRSIQNSIQIKRRETSMVEAVSAEEIGKLPDVSIAESIARLPGLTAQRVAGRAQIVSIRGFSPDFSTVLLNGRQQASSGFSRAVEFDQYPSELRGSVVVYKTPDAGISGMGLAGTVDLRTIRPLEYGKRAIVINLRGEYDQGGGRNAEMSNKGWRGSVSYIGQNKEGTLGWMLGYAHLDAPGHINHAKDWYYENYGGNFGGGDENILAGQEVRAYTSRDIRDGITGTLEWKPSDAIHSVLDLYYSRFKQHTTMHGAEWFSDAWIGKPTTFSNIQVETRQGVPFAKSGHVDGADLVLRNDDNQRTDHLFSAGLNKEFGGGFLSSFDVGLDYTRRHKTKTVDEHNLMLRNFRQMVPVDPRFVNDPTSLDFAGDWKVIDIDILDALSTYYDTTPVTDTAHYDKSWSITEDIVTGFAKANINSGDLHGNVGVQVVRQRQESKGLRINGTGVTTVLEPVDVTRTYTDVLPTLNLFYDLDTKNRIRFAAAKVMARPRMDDMRANLVPGFDSCICNSGNSASGAVVHPCSAGGGNPHHSPCLAKDVDNASEWYDGH